MGEDTVYLDNSTSTRMDERVLEAMKPYFLENYAVATSEFAYSDGIKAKEALDEARKSLASSLGCEAEEFIFTSGGTESSNLAVKGAARANSDEGNHIVTTEVEDFPVLNSMEALEKDGFDVTYLEVDDEGFVDPTDLENSIKDDTILVSIQHANQEIGTLQNIEALSEVCEEEDVIFHTDATHTFGRVPFNLGDLPVNLATVSAHTIHGPKGIGGLYVEKGTQIEKQMDGGFQEKGLRAGVENIPGAVGFAKAADLITEEENEEIKDMRDELIDRLMSEVSDTTLNGPREDRKSVV